MHDMTKQNVGAAFVGESQAHMKYLAFADVAEKEGKPNIARLFKAVAYAEQVHATNHLRVLAGIGGTAENLKESEDGETFEIDEMYPVYLNAAQLQGEKDAEKTMHYALEAERIHQKIYAQAREAVRQGKDVSSQAIVVCPVCGYTVEGSEPDVCPVCGVKGSMFRRF